MLDAYDRIIAVTEYNQDYYLLDNESYNTTYSYNGADELIGIRDTYGNHFNFTYDSLGRKTQLNDPDLGKWLYSYDLASNLIKQADNKGNNIYLSYDELNRIKNKNTSSQIFAFAYDKQYQGTLSNLSYDNITYTYTYDDRLRNIKEVLKIRHHTIETGLTYDSMDRILEARLPDNDNFDYYYNLQGKLHRVNNYINKTQYNPFGSPLNRTYFNAKLTQFDYYSDTARLKQIKTDTSQNFNYSYDKVGNVLSINDSANNRLYSMSYDNLDRLTNVTINGFSWVYSYDAIGNVLKIVRNSSQTTFLKYLGSVPHFPSKVITADTGIDVYRYSGFNTSNKTRVFEFYLINEKNTSLTNVNWTAEFGDSSVIDSNQEFNLSLKENILVILEHNYSKGDNYRINFTGRSSSTANDYESINLLFGAIANHLNILKQNGTTIVSEFSAKNTINQISQNWTWDCGNGIVSTVPFNMSSNQELLVIIENNYSLKPEYNLTCKINSTDGNQSASTKLTFDSIKIENYNSTVLDTDTISVNFQIRNYYSTLSNIKWNVTSDGRIYNASGITLNQGETTSISQEINFTNAGLKVIKVTIGSNNLTDTYTENIKLYSLGIQDFLDIVKNGTTRIFNFIIQNNWYNLTAKFNISNPVIENTTALNQTESLIVVIEEDYGQGNKQADVKVFNNSVNEESLLEIFRIRQIEISSLQTLHENGSRSVISSIVKNNINPLNISWQLNNSEELITSNQNLELNTSEQGIIIIGSNYSASGIYPLIFVVNSSTYNDNATGVSVS